MTTGRSVHVDKFKAVQVRLCLLVYRADTSHLLVKKQSY